jgi:hypothetical protein
MGAKYITLKTADETTINKRFRIISGGYQEQLIKPGEVGRAITGALDVKSGKILEVYNFVARVRHTEEEGSSYGVRADLRALFMLNDPTDEDTPDLITMIDHFGQTVEGYMIGELGMEPLTTVMIGVNAWSIYMFQFAVNV